MSIGPIDHNTSVDLEEAESMGKRSDIGLLVVSFIYLLNLLVSVVYVWYNTYTADSIVINAAILLENILFMVFVVYAFNKYRL